jgi:iron complex transport system permease protein
VLALALGLCLLYGEETIKILEIFSSEQTLSNIVFWKLRLPKTLAALSAGGGLAIVGLLLQTFFRNPLAGPYILGIHSGASLGVALWIFLLYSLGITQDSWWRLLGSSGFAMLGAFALLMILLFFSKRLSHKSLILILGLLFAQLAGGILNVFYALSGAEELRTFLVWSLGSFKRISEAQLWGLIGITVSGTIAGLSLLKRLNALLLGEGYAQSMGVNVKSTQFILLTLCAVLVGAVNAFCGPIAFVGTIVSHMARWLFRSQDHRLLYPASFLLGGLLCVMAESALTFAPLVSLPVNALLGILGVPLVLIVLFRQGREVI